MNPLQYTIITTLAIAAGASILFFDGRGKAHRPGASLTAWHCTLKEIGLEPQRRSPFPFCTSIVLLKNWLNFV